MAGYQSVPNPGDRSYGGTADTGAAPVSSSGNKRLQQTQAQVDEVVDIMRTNVDKVLERDEKLSELDNRADALQQGASQFETQAAKLKRKYWWKNCKMIILLSSVVAIIVIIVINVGNPNRCYISHNHYYYRAAFLLTGIKGQIS